MKFIFKMIILVPALAQASMVKIQYHPTRWEEAQIAREVFKNRHQIPAEVIHLHQSNQCEAKDHRFLELCINSKGELYELSSDQNINKIRKSLRTFALGGQK